jgi:hypothetical protein
VSLSVASDSVKFSARNKETADGPMQKSDRTCKIVFAYVQWTNEH